MMDSLKDAVLHGKFDRYDYSRIVGLKNHVNTIYGQTAFFRVDNILYTENYSPDVMTKIDQNRKELGVETFDQLRAKVLFSLNDHRFNLRTGAITTYSFATEHDKNTFLKSKIRLE